RRNRYEPSNPRILQLYRRERAVVTPSSPCPLFLEMRTGAIVNRLESINEGFSNAPATTADSTDVVVGPRGVASIPGHPEDCADQHASNWTGTRSRVEGDSRSAANKMRQHQSRSSRQRDRANPGGASVSSDEWH